MHELVKSLSLWRSPGLSLYGGLGLAGGITPRMQLQLSITRKDGAKEQVPVTLRIDTPIEVDYYLNGGILPYVLRQLLD